MCAERSATLLTAIKLLVTTSIIKSDVVPALRAGAASLFSGGDTCEVSDMHGQSLRENILDVVTIFALRFMSVVQRREVLWGFRTGADVVRCKGGHFQEPVHRPGDEQVLFLYERITGSLNEV